MHFVFLLPRFHSNIYYAVEALRNRGHRVSIYVQNESEDLGSVVPVRLGTSFPWYLPLKMLGRDKPDLLIARLREGSWWWFSLFGLLFAKHRVSYDQVPWYGGSKARIRWSRIFRALPLRRLTPVASKFPVRSKSADPNAYYVPFPVNVPAEAGARAYAPAGRVRIVCVAKLAQPRKRHFLLLNALAELAPDLDFEVTLAGSSTLNASGATDDYLTRVLDQELSGLWAGRLKILKDVPFSEMTALYLRHDVAVLPSKKEPLGTAPLEAMACGCVPIISDDCGSAGYVSADCGFVFPSDEPAALVDVLKTLLSAPELCASMGRLAIEKVRRDYNPEDCADKFEALARGKLKPSETRPS